MNKIHELLNTQVNKEFYSAYLYLDISNFYSDKGLDGFANYFKIQAQEELAHADLFIQYMKHINLNVTLETIAKPDAKLDDIRSGLVVALEHEKLVTSYIKSIYKQALEDEDFITKNVLDWFMKEQGEEEKNATDLLQKFDLFGTEPRSLYMLDNELKSRTYSAPSLII